MGVDALLDAISIQAEVMELTAVVDGRAQGVVVESSLDKGRGPVATLLEWDGRIPSFDEVWTEAKKSETWRASALAKKEEHEAA